MLFWSIAKYSYAGQDTKTSKKAHLLLHCLSYQARDEVIMVLKSDKTDSALLGAHYGFNGLEKVLHALQRDSLQAQQDHLQDVYKKPISEVTTDNTKKLHTIWSGQSNLMRWMHYCDKRASIITASLHKSVILHYMCWLYWFYSSVMIMHLSVYVCLEACSTSKVT